MVCSEDSVMKQMLSSVFKISGISLVVISFAMLPPLLVCVGYGEMHAAAGFAHAIWIGLLVGMVLFLLFRTGTRVLRVRDGFLVLAVCWLTASVFGAFPYLFTDTIASPVDAFFESASGFSTTGVTVFEDVESLPHGILFWRSMTSWLGALGILVFAVALIPSLGINGSDITLQEEPSGRIDLMSPKTRRVMFGLTLAVIILTVAAAGLLAAGGMGIFDAFIHSMGTVSTGGFSNYNSGLTHFIADNSGIYSGLYIKYVIVFFMIIFGTSFTLFYSAIRSGLRVFKYDTEYNLYWIIILLASLLLFLSFSFSFEGTTAAEDISDGIFHAVSILTTTGYTTGNPLAWPAFSQMVLLMLMFIGSCSSSAGSGNKVVRFIVLSELLFFRLRTRLHTTVFKSVRLNGRDIPNDTVSGITNHLFLYIVMVFVGAFVLSLENVNFMDCFTTSVSLLGNVGPVLIDHGGSSACFAELHWFTKGFMSLMMIAGRLELYTILVLFTPRFWRAD